MCYFISYTPTKTFTEKYNNPLNTLHLKDGLDVCVTLHSLVFQKYKFINLHFSDSYI